MSKRFQSFKQSLDHSSRFSWDPGESSSLTVFDFDSEINAEEMKRFPDQPDKSNREKSKRKKADDSTGSSKKIHFTARSLGPEPIHVHTYGMMGQKNGAVGIYWRRNHTMNMGMAIRGRTSSQKANFVAIVQCLFSAYMEDVKQLVVYAPCRYVIKELSKYQQNRDKKDPNYFQPARKYLEIFKELDHWTNEFTSIVYEFEPSNPIQDLAKKLALDAKKVVDDEDRYNDEIDKDLGFTNDEQIKEKKKKRRQPRSINLVRH